MGQIEVIDVSNIYFFLVFQTMTMTLTVTMTLIKMTQNQALLKC